jgi:hypothetical protein
LTLDTPTLEVMGDRWINAVIEITVPLDVAPEARDEAKRDAVAALLEDLELPQDAVATERWEHVEDGEPVTRR